MTAKQQPVKVAVDAMGGDYAPQEIIAGAIEAARKSDVHIALVGDATKIELELANHNVSNLPINIVPSEGVITEDESPALALRNKPKASILVATKMVKDGYVDACVSMGSTGAAMAAATVIIGVIDGIDRPALGGPIFGLAPKTIVMDLGSNVDCRPHQLLNFAVIGDVFARLFWNVTRPRVGILSVGAESGKGNRQVREASQLLGDSELNFVGNVEANDIMQNKVEVVVCDGFVGNVIMKLAEGLGKSIANHLTSTLNGKIPNSELEKLVQEVYELNSVVEAAGGGPLYGINGVSVVGHGRSKAPAVHRAISTAKKVVEGNFIAKLNEELSQLRSEDK